MTSKRVYSPKRIKIAMVCSLLEALQNKRQGLRKTVLARKTGLSGKEIDNFIILCLNKGFILKQEEKYLLTYKGDELKEEIRKAVKEVKRLEGKIFNSNKGETWTE